MARALFMLIFPLFNFAFSCYGSPSLDIYMSPTVQPSYPSSLRKIVVDFGFAPVPIISPLLKHHHHHRHHHHHHHHREKPHVASPPSTVPGCDQTCEDPFTSTPFGSPCGCVIPMKLKLLLDASLYAIFPVVNELEIEIAAGTYLKQSQVKIAGAISDDQNQDKTVVDVNLVPLGAKFDNTTAILTYERFWQKKVPLNVTLFGNYQVVNISYPGIPSLPLPGSYMGSGPSGSAGKLPIPADIADKKNSETNPRTLAIIALSIFVVLLICVGSVFLILKWRKIERPLGAIGPLFSSSINKRSGISGFISSTASSTSMSLTSNLANCMLSVQRFPLSELEKATDKFSSKRILGEGGFGRVYSATMENGTEVAVKLLTRDNNQKNGDDEIIAEVEMLSRLHHRNLVKLIGICIEKGKRCLVYELVRNGSIDSYLHGADKKKGPLDWDARIKIALGAARGLAYLHEDSNPRVIHRDFKASNVLLEDDFTAKVSDFGLAREATEGSQHISTRVMGTFGYVAPEYAMTGHLLVKSDVYSFGVVLLELISGRKPVDMSQPQGQENLVTWARPLLTNHEGLELLVDPTLFGNCDFDDVAKVAAIASMCVHPEVTHRPFMGEVVQALKLIYKNNNTECEDFCSQKVSSCPDSDFNYEANSSFVTMEYNSSGSLDERENQRLSLSSSLIGDGILLPIRHGNRSGPLKMIRSKPAFYRARGSISEHGRLVSKSFWNDEFWV